MRSLEQHLNSINFSKELAALRNLIVSKDVHVKKTFWGGREITVKGYNGTVSLENIAYKLLKAANHRREDDNLSPKERIVGIEITRKLTSFYRITDTQIKNSNFLTKLLNWIRNFAICDCSTIRWHIENITEDTFRSYSKSRFLKTFGGDKAWDKKISNHPVWEGSFGPPYRIIVKEKEIRKLIT